MKNRFVLILAVSFFIITRARGDGPADPGANRDNPTGNAGALKGQIQTGGSYDAHSGNGTRVVNDLRFPGALGAYGLDFTRYWNSTQNDYDDGEAEIPTDFGQSGWSHSWRWSAVVGYDFPDEIPGTNTHNNIYKTKITITFPDGHTTKYKISRVGHGQWLVPPGDPVWGPPYTPAEIASGWPYGGVGVHDHICNMAANGTEFWLCRADGGSVHFTGGPASYQATEVFDPHGLKTTLTYNSSGLLEWVTQDGGRYLHIVWSGFADSGWLITRVETGGGGGGSRYVSYIYKRQGGYFHVLTLVRYEDDPTPGQTAFAVYTYGTCYGDETEPCAWPAGSTVPLLKRADDPRYAGAMTKIRYNYAGTGCPPILIEPWFHPEWVGAQPYRIAEEKSDTGDVVSRFLLNCDGGEREEFNGLGGHRKFYFGRAAQTASPAPSPQAGVAQKGFQLGRITDFTNLGYIAAGIPCPPGVPCHRQTFSGGHPRRIWDGRNIMTEQIITPGDDSGSPGEVHYVDGSSCIYDRVNPGNSLAPNGSGMHNPYNHWLFSKKDELGNVTTYTRDSRRRVTQVAYYNGPAQGSPIAVESYTYNDKNQVTTHTLPSGAVQTYVYNTLNQLVLEFSSGNEERKEYAYDVFGRVETMRDTQAIAENAPYTERKEYNGRNEVTKVHYRPAGGGSDPTVTYQYDKYGNRTAVIDELGHRKDFTYDAYRRCTSTTEQISPGPGCNSVQVRRWDWIYDRVIEGGTNNPYPASAHTGKEWRIQIEPAFNDAGHRRASSRTFDVNNRMLSEQTGLIHLPGAPLGTLQPPGPDAETHRVTYDQNGQKHSSTDSLNRVTEYGYDNRNRLETTTEPKRQDQPNHPVIRFEYDVAGNKRKVTFPDMKTQRWESYDTFGQAWQFFDERNNQTDLTYQWGPMKKLDTVRTYRQKDNPPGGTETQETNFEYDLMGRPTWTYFPDGSSELNGYALGQLSAFKTRKNQTKRLHYDARGREIYHTWDADAAPRIDRVWDDANRMTRISNNFSIIDYQYNEAGEVRTEGTTVTGDGVVREVRYCRNSNGDLSQITYPNGTVVNRFYTPRGQLQSVGWGVGSTSYAYLRDGKVDYQARTNGVTTSYGYDGRGTISSLEHKNGSNQSLAYRTYWRDDRDRITAWKRGPAGGPNEMEDGRGDRYRYDDEGQLDRASYRVANPESSPGVAQRSDEFHYDALGNRTGWNNVASRGAMEFRRKNNGLNQYFSWANSYPNPPQHWGTTTNYDDDVGGGWGAPGAANGVLMQDGWITAGFDALNRPVCIWSPAYPGGDSAQWLRFGYDPLGRCVKRWKTLGNGTPVAAATYYYYDGWNLIQEGSNTTTERVYVHGGRVDEIVASWNGQWYNHHYDARGHCILLTSANGSIQEQYDYDAFGLPYVYQANGTLVPLKLGSPAGNRFLFTGREWIKDHRIYDYRNRMYQPELGRFLQPDPTGFSAGDYNLYRYCHNDPVNKSDPMGLYSALTGWGGGDWIKGSDGLSAWDRDHGMPSNQPGRSITMAQVSQVGEEKGGKNSNANANAQMRMVPRLADDGATAIPRHSDHTGGEYEYQLSAPPFPPGHRVSGAGYSILEKLSLVPGVPNNRKVGIKQEEWKPLQSNGIFPDHVGIGFRPSQATSITSVVYQTFQLKYNGQPVPVSTVLKHDVRYANGRLSHSVRVEKP